MHLQISQRSDIPIYQQIKDQLTQQILSGRLAGGTKLPSIRGLAQELHISVITVKKAYEELEKDGYIITMAAKGSYITQQNNAELAENQLKRIEDLLAAAVDEASILHISEEQMHEIIRRLFAEQKTR